MLEPFISHSRATRYDTLNRILQSTQCPCTPYITGTKPCTNRSSDPATSRLRIGSARGHRLLPHLTGTRRYMHASYQCKYSTRPPLIADPAQSEPQRTGTGTGTGTVWYLTGPNSLSAVAALLSANSNCRAGWYCNPRSSRLPVFPSKPANSTGSQLAQPCSCFLHRHVVSSPLHLISSPYLLTSTVSIVASAVPRNSVPADLHPPLTPVLPNIHVFLVPNPVAPTPPQPFSFSPPFNPCHFSILHRHPPFFSFFQSSLDDSATLANSRLTPSLFLSFFSFSLFTRSPVGCAGHQLRALHKHPQKINTSSLFFSRLIDNRLDPQRHSFPKAHPITPSTVAFGRSTPRPTSWLTLLCPRTRLLRRQYSKWITPTSTDDEASSLATFWETRLRSPPRLLLLCVPSRALPPFSRRRVESKW